MGKLLASMLFLAACVGDRPEAGPPYSGGGETMPGGGDTTTTRYAPQACGEMSWAVKAGAVDFAVVGRGPSLQLLSVPLAGGAVSAFTFDKDMNLRAVDPTIQLDSGMTSVSASAVGDYLVATSGNGSSLHITALTPDLSASLPLAQVAPGLVAKSALQPAGTHLILPVADDQGLRIERFDQTWNASTLRVARSEPAVAMTAAAMRDATVAVWSTAASCNAMAIGDAAVSWLDTVPGACLAPTLAINPGIGRGALVFEGNDGIRMLDWSGTSFRGVSQLLTIGGSSPRSVFDGHRIWISELDNTGHLVVGYLDNGQLVATTLDTRPMGSTYDLVVRNGYVWAVTQGPDVYEAHRVCVEPTNG